MRNHIGRATLALCCCARAAGIGASAAGRSVDGGRGPAQPGAGSPAQTEAARARALWSGGAHRPCAPRPPLGASAEAALERASARYAIDVSVRGSELRKVLKADYKFHARLPKRVRWESTLDPSTPVNRSICARMFADAGHPVHSMFGMAWVKMGPTCLPQTRADGEGWVRAMEAGDMCSRIWFQGTSNCSSTSYAPNFAARAAPALLGTDPGIDGRCRWWQRDDRWHRPIRGQGKQNCIHAGFNVLALFGAAPTYNLCRNLEWVVCAARGHLHRQPASQLVFDPPPKEVTMSAFDPVCKYL
jgi:hypothetical protein